MFTLDYSVRPTIERAKKTQALLSDLTWLWEEVSHDWWLEQAEKNFATHGAHSGQDWTLAPKYRRYKSALQGVLVDPLRWAPGREQIYPSTTDKSHALHVWQAYPDGYVIGSDAPNLEELKDGGVGPFGEAFSPANPLHATQEQLDDLAMLEQMRINERLRELGWEVV